MHFTRTDPGTDEDFLILDPHEPMSTFAPIVRRALNKPWRLLRTQPDLC